MLETYKKIAAIAGPILFICFITMMILYIFSSKIGSMDSGTIAAIVSAVGTFILLGVTIAYLIIIGHEVKIAKQSYESQRRIEEASSYPLLGIRINKLSREGPKQALFEDALAVEFNIVNLKNTIPLRIQTSLSLAIEEGGSPRRPLFEPISVPFIEVGRNIYLKSCFEKAYDSCLGEASNVFQKYLEIKDQGIDSLIQMKPDIEKYPMLRIETTYFDHHGNQFRTSVEHFLMSLDEGKSLTAWPMSLERSLIYKKLGKITGE